MLDHPRGVAMISTSFTVLSDRDLAALVALEVGRRGRMKVELIM